jgi:quinol---cytochrome c reductase iron-sulfur subunit, bacillus type
MIEGTTGDRRNFLVVAIYGLGALIGLALTVPAAIYLLWPPRPKKETEWVDAGRLTQLQPRMPEEVVFRRNRADGWKITSEKATAWVVKLSPKDLIAFAPQCPHLGCAYHWEAQNQEFLCPCHASRFTIEGNVISGPSPRPLDRYEMKIEGDKLLLGRTYQSTERPS